MGVIIRQSSISSAITYLGVVIGYFNVLWFFPKYFNNLDEFGLFRLITELSMLMVPFAQMGLSTTLTKFFPEFNESRQKTQAYLNSFLLTGIITFGIFLLLFFTFRIPILEYVDTRSENARYYLKIVLILIFILSMTGVLEAYSKSLLKIIFPNFIKEVLIRILTGAVVGLYALDLISLDQLIASLVLVYGIALISLILYLISLKQFSFHIDFSIFNNRALKSIVIFCGFAILSSSSSLIVQKIDSVMVADIIGLDQTAIYTTAFYIATVIEIPRRIASQIMVPLVADNFNQNNLPEVRSLYKKSSINFLIIGSLILIGIISNLDSVYFLVPNWRDFAPGKEVVVIVGFAKLTDMATGINSEIIVMSRYYKFNIIAVTCLAAVTITGNLLLIPSYGITGAALATLISVCLFNLAKLIFIFVVFKMHPFSWNTLKVLVTAAAVFFLIIQIPRTGYPIPDILIKAVLTTILYSFIVIRLKFSDEANRFVKQIFSKIGL